MKSLTSFTLLITLLLSPVTYSKDIGQYGQVFEIKEMDFLDFIYSKLAEAERSGKLADLQENFKSKVQNNALRPKPVIGLMTTTNPKRFFVNPSVTLINDIVDTQGRVIAKAGTVVNPFRHLQTRYKGRFAFFDGDDPRQLNWALTLIQENPENLKLVLVNGDVGKVTKQLNTKIYFDQNGYLIGKLSIKNIPSLAFENNFEWEIKEYDASMYKF